MSFPTQFSLSLELANLANILPIRAGLTHTASAIISLARELKRSGSDLLVEEDLATIFGRGRIVPSLENHFRHVVSIASFTPLHEGAEIVLKAGPDATVRRALKDGHYYLSTVIQLSFLAFMHEDSSLAATLVESMLRRLESKIPDATSDPNYDGILGTLQACASQTSQYPWEILVELIESRFPKSAIWFRLYRSPLKRLSSNVLSGAMDYLYLAQSLPEDRVMAVENQMGLVPLVVWAHCILGLTVLVKGSPDGDILFETSANPQVVISWSHEWEIDRYSQEVKEPSDPITYLLDGKMEVVLKVESDQNENVKIEGQELHRLEGFGTSFLRRMFNMESIITDDDPLYAEVVQYAVAFAIMSSKYTCCVPKMKANFDIPEQCYGRVENIRIIKACEMLCSGITISKREINVYVDKLTGVKIKDMAVPPTLRRYIENSKVRDTILGQRDVMQYIWQLGSWILAFAQVVDLQTCADLPLICYPDSLNCGFISLWEGAEPIKPNPNDWFLSIASMITGLSGLLNISHGKQGGVFLISHHGWSVFYNCIGDCDPADVTCELISIKRGVPTNLRTNERKYMVSDAPRIQPKKGSRSPVIIDKGDSYLPRCLSRVTKRTELYSTRSYEFVLSIRFDIDESGTPLRSKEAAKYSLYASYEQFQKGLWAVIKTLPCSHSHQLNNKAQPLDLSVVTAKGLDWVCFEQLDARICICLVKGDARARWLIIAGIIIDESGIEIEGELRRSVMLRSHGCCEDCAVKAASAMAGKWLVIL